MPHDMQGKYLPALKLCEKILVPFYYKDELPAYTYINLLFEFILQMKNIAGIHNIPGDIQIGTALVRIYHQSLEFKKVNMLLTLKSIFSLGGYLDVHRSSGLNCCVWAIAIYVLPAEA